MRLRKPLQAAHNRPGHTKTLTAFVSTSSGLRPASFGPGTRWDECFPVGVSRGFLHPLGESHRDRHIPRLTNAFPMIRTRNVKEQRLNNFGEVKLKAV